jgi:hypothetical protein
VLQQGEARLLLVIGCFEHARTHNVGSDPAGWTANQICCLSESQNMKAHIPFTLFPPRANAALARWDLHPPIPHRTAVPNTPHSHQHQSPKPHQFVCAHTVIFVLD